MKGDTLPREADGIAEPSPLLDIWAKISATIDGMARETHREVILREKLWAHLHEIQITGPNLSTTTTPEVLVGDRPDLLGPHTGYHWDVRRISFGPADPATMWQGHIWVYKSQPVGTSLLWVFDPAQPVHTWGKAYLMLTPHDRLVYVAGPDFTGTAEIGGAALLVIDECVPLYLS